ncbi:MAG: cyclic nucleotide-binding domain-containing protein, partial [Opitutae bacterium]
RQVFSTLDAGNCFGEMAFLSAGVASANVSARGRAVIWRMSHEMLLNYVENCKGGSQLVLNIAASLSGRVQEGNRRLLDVTDRMGAQILKMKNEGQGNLDEMEKELDGLMSAYQGMEASKKEEDLKPL